VRKNAVRRWPGHPSATTVARSQRSYVTPGIPANAWSKRSAAIVRWTEWRSLCSVTKWGAPRQAREGVSIDQSNHRSDMAPIPGLRPGASSPVHRPQAASRNEHTREIGRDLPTHGEPRGRRANARWPGTCQGRAPGVAVGSERFPSTEEANREHTLQRRHHKPPAPVGRKPPLAPHPVAPLSDCCPPTLPRARSAPHGRTRDG